MGRRLIEVMQVLADQVHKGGYQHRVLEDSIYAETQKRIAAEKDRDHWREARRDAIEAGELMKAEIETLRKQLADAQRAASDEFTERQVLTVEQQQDAAAWQQQVDSANAEVSYLRARLDEERSVSAGLREQLDAAQAEIEKLKGAMAADDQRLRDAEQRVWPERTLGCDAPDAMADEILHLRQQLDAAQAAVALQRAGIERLRRFVGGVEGALGAFQSISPDTCCDQIARCLSELEDSPAPVAERCPECDGSGMVDSGGFGPDGKGINVPCGGDCRGNPCPSQPTPVTEPLDAESDTCPGK